MSNNSAVFDHRSSQNIQTLDPLVSESVTILFGPGSILRLPSWRPNVRQKVESLLLHHCPSSTLGVQEKPCCV